LDLRKREAQLLEEQLAETTARVRDYQDRIAQLRIQLAIPADVADGKTTSSVDGETMRHYSTVLIDSRATYTREQTMLAQFKKLDADDLANALPTDDILSQLLKDQNANEARLAALQSDFGKDNPQVVQAEKVEATLRKQIYSRTSGIMQGMETRVNSLKAVIDETQKKMDEAKKDDAVAIRDYQPYFDTRHDLEALQKKRDALMTRLDELKTEMQLKEAASAK
jgi:uncharacterized protein involved in exopolysaccharide biosynthesis